MKKITQVVLLAAGGSSRFYPFNYGGHKSLLVLRGKTLIEHTISNLAQHGIKEVIVVENSSQEISKSGVVFPQSISVRFVMEAEALGMGDGLLSASDILDDSFFLLNAYHFEVVEMLSELEISITKDTDIAVLTKEEQDLSQFGMVVKEKGKLKIVEKEGNSSGIRIVGAYALNKEFVTILHATKLHEYNFEDALSEYSNQHELVLVDAKNPTFSLKFPWNILDAKDMILNTMVPGISKKAKISKSAEISGNVVIEDGVTIMESAVIKGPAYIGKNAFIGNNAILRDGVCVEEGAVVGANMEVKNAVIMRHATTHSGFIGDSVVGEYTKIAAGFNTANVRLDREEVFSVVKGKKIGTKRKALGVLMGSHNSVGIKVGTMPGIIIGNNTIIGPGTTVMENISDDTSYYTEFKKIVKK